MADNAEQLVSMALDRFGPLTETEERLFRTAANGEVADYCVGSDELDNPANVSQWGRKRILKAERLTWLCITPHVRPLLTGNRIQVKGAKIEGVFLLNDAKLDSGLVFSKCVFTDPISFENTNLPSIEFTLTHVITIHAPRLQAAGSVHFWNGFIARGPINLDAARIGGDLRCDRGLFIYKQIPGGIQFSEDAREAFRAAALEVKGFVSFIGSVIQGGLCLYQARIDSNLFCDGSGLFNKGRYALLATGAKIGGAVYLAGRFRALGQVNLEFAEIGGSLNCEGALFLHWPAFKDRTAQPPALNLESTDIKGSVYLKKWFLASGRVHLHGTKIGGHLDCAGGRFMNLGGCAILGNHASISNGVLLSNGFYAGGEVILFATTIGGNLECTSGHFVNCTGNALSARRAEVSGDILLNGYFRAEGAVTLYAITVRGDLRCDDGQFINPAGNALEMERANVNGHVILSDGFRAEGMVNLIRTTIGGNLQCLGAEFSCPEIKTSEFPLAGPSLRRALQLESANIGGSVMMRWLLKDDNTRKPFIADGAVHLLNTRVGGNVECQGCAFRNENGDALVLAGAQIAGDLILGPGFHAHGRLNLSALKIDRVCCMFKFVEAEMKITSLDIRFSNVATIYHDPDSWPKAGGLLLNGLVYKNVSVGGGVSLDGLAYQNDFAAPAFPENWRKSLEWLRLQPTKPIALQPYEQLANVMKSLGYESEATEVLIAKQDDLRRYGDLRWEGKLWNLLLGLSIGHGYKPRRALFGMLIFVLFGTIAFQFGDWCHLITPVQSVANERKSRMNYPKFQAFIYSLDTFLPIVDLKQKGYWLPNANQGDDVIPGVRFRWGGLLRFYFWVHTLFGWILTTLWVAGFTGLVRRLN